VRERPVFDSEHPDDVQLTPEEQAAVDEGLRRRRELQASEDEIPDIRPRSPREQ
jgi:hypothetical protein